MAELNKKETERKSPEEIKLKILEALNEKPLNALEISKQIGSNWSTVKNYVGEMVKNGKIKEMQFRGNSFYLKITGDTYFNIPITSKERETFKFIFSYAIKRYQEIIGKSIRRTELSKLSAEINTDLKLNLPIVWYIYGPMPLMIIDLQRDYQTRIIPENADKLKKAIEAWIKNNTRNLIRELRVEYYQKSENEVYILKERIYQALESQRYEKIPDLSFQLLTATISYDPCFEEILKEFYGIISGANYIKLLENAEFQNKLILTFDSLWKYIASNMLRASLIKLKYQKEEIDLLLGMIIEAKSYLALDNLNELKEFYLENLPEKLIPPKLSAIDSEARKIVDKWMDSGVWRQ
jgi:predicted transcriptional regulator